MTVSCYRVQQDWIRSVSFSLWFTPSSSRTLTIVTCPTPSVWSSTVARSSSKSPSWWKWRDGDPLWFMSSYIHMCCGWVVLWPCLHYICSKFIFYREITPSCGQMWHVLAKWVGISTFLFINTIKTCCNRTKMTENQLKAKSRWIFSSSCFLNDIYYVINHNIAIFIWPLLLKIIIHSSLIKSSEWMCD